jgi:hypothetical protein
MFIRFSAFVSVALASFVCDAAASQESAPEAPPVQAIWKHQELQFTFQSFTTFYSCSSLETKVKRILTAVGGNPEMKMRTRGCFSPHDIARMPHMEIDIVAAVEATPEALAERDKTSSTRELAARVRGQTKELEEVLKPFPAQWKTVSLSRGKLYLEPGDCELVDQLKDKVFPKIGVKVVEDGVSCPPNQTSMSQPKLVVQALIAMPSPDAK